MPLRVSLALLAALLALPASFAVAASPRRPVAAPSPPIVALVVTPGTLLLDGPYAETRALVEARLTGGESRDVSVRATWTVADPKVAGVDALGTVRPRQDGATALIARYRGRTARVPITVRGVTGAKAPRFLTDVLPILTRSGCNQGSCHGAASGKGGLKLSLLGYDPDAGLRGAHAGQRRAARLSRAAGAEPDAPQADALHPS